MVADRADAAQALHDDKYCNFCGQSYKRSGDACMQSLSLLQQNLRNRRQQQASGAACMQGHIQLHKFTPRQSRFPPGVVAAGVVGAGVVFAGVVGAGVVAAGVVGAGVLGTGAVQTEAQRL